MQSLAIAYHQKILLLVWNLSHKNYAAYKTPINVGIQDLFLLTNYLRLSNCFNHNIKAVAVLKTVNFLEALLKVVRVMNFRQKRSES